MLTLGAGAAFAQVKEPAVRLMATAADGSVSGDLDEPSGVPEAFVNVDISGVESWDLLDDPDNTILTEALGAGATMTGVGWDVTLTTVGASWLSEAITYFDGQDLDGSGLFLTVGVGNGAPGSMSFDSGGVCLDLTDNGIPNIPIGNDGNLYMQFFESFDDVADSADAAYEDGSSYDICYIERQIPPTEIPTLNTVGLVVMLLLLAGLGMFFLTRQLRRA
jgi:hypothetical protein